MDGNKDLGEPRRTPTGSPVAVGQRRIATTMGGTTIPQALQARAGAGSGQRTARSLPLRVLFVLLLLVAVAYAAGRPAPAAAGVDDNIDAALRQGGFDGSGTGVYVWDLDAAQPVYDHNADLEYTPASNLKLVTSAASLLDWGPTHRFVTELYLPDIAVSSSGTLDGDIYLRGLGDPSLSTKDYASAVFDLTTASFQYFARTLKREGVRKVTGRVLGDASWFDKLKTVPTWKDGLQLECGPLSALSGDQGLDNGNRVSAPATWAAKLMTEACREAGVKVKGKPGSGKVPDGALLLKRQYSAAMPGILRHMNQASDNFFAETLLKGLGKDFYDEGSTKAGTQASRDTLHAIGVKTGTYVIQDGSGLSYGNKITPLGITQVLGSMRQNDDFDVYYDSLAVAGEDGTVDERMRGTAAAGNAHVKTGTLNVAVCLSGYVESANEHLVAFSIMMNGGSVGSSGWGAATKTQDTIVAALAKAKLPGEPVLTVTPTLRAFSTSAAEPVHAGGGRLKPGVQP
jgi:serine-type D-Ala-D-Ala carboxypeptidase/endopeptidase (penicillin-binding protein 4)